MAKAIVLDATSGEVILDQRDGPDGPDGPDGNEIESLSAFKTVQQQAQELKVGQISQIIRCFGDGSATIESQTTAKDGTIAQSSVSGSSLSEAIVYNDILTRDIKGTS